MPTLRQEIVELLLDVPRSPREIAEWIGRVARNPEDEAELARIKSEVVDLCKAFPLYPGFEA